MIWQMRLIDSIKYSFGVKLIEGILLCCVFGEPTSKEHLPYQSHQCQELTKLKGGMASSVMEL